MAVLALTRRKTQLAMLAEACRTRRRARVAQRAPQTDDPGSIETRFLALQPDAVLLRWPSQGTGRIAARGATVEVVFQHQQQLLGFRAPAQGPVWHPRASGGPVRAWKLAVPLCIEPREPRRDRRIALDGRTPIDARCTSTADNQRSFTARLRDLSTGGFRISASLGEAGWVQRGDVLWACIALPGGDGSAEFVARVVHAHASAPHGIVVLGCRFCPRDDSTEHDRQWARLRQGLAQLGRGRGGA